MDFGSARSVWLCVWLPAILCGTLEAQVQQPSPVYFSVPAADAPELAQRGKYKVGVQTISLTHAHQVDILHFNDKQGTAPFYDRPLTLEVWYPATIAAGQSESTTYISPMPGRNSVPEKSFAILGKALRDAAPAAGTRFPLVIVSHGYPGSRTFLTYLTENLASKGYVVAAIDHTDSVFGEVRGFPSTLLNRSADQLFAIESLRELEKDASHFLHGLVDAQNVAIVGYSMGGYGALTSAGAGLNQRSPLMKLVPGGYLGDWTAGSAKYQAVDRSAIKAIVAIAPWGKQAPYEAWEAAGLANIRVPALFIAGDHDDVADFAGGIKPAFEQAVRSDRYLLVYDEARHNTGGNPPPPGVTLDYGSIESFDEPVWRKERIAAINQHFVTAFLDWKLKGDDARRKYLELPMKKSDEGVWKLAPGVRDDGGFSTGKDDAGNAFWPGFQRRWALGLDWVHLEAAK